MALQILVLESHVSAGNYSVMCAQIGEIKGFYDSSEKF